MNIKTSKPPEKLPTIRDVARLSGMSRGTVSNVLNHSPLVHPETKARVLQAIAELNYRPNAVAQRLAGKTLNILGVAFSYSSFQSIAGTYFSQIQDGIMNAADRTRQNLLLFSAQTWVNRQESMATYCGGHCDGLILIAPPVESDMIPALREADFPFVVVSDTPSQPDVTCVDIDNHAAARAMMDYLIGQGHRRIAVLCLDHFLGCSRARLTGCRAAAKAAGLPGDALSVLTSRSAVESGLEALTALPPAERPTAVFCFSDTEASAVIDTLQRQGLRVPEDISVAGFNDEPLSRTTRIPITTVRQPLTEIGDRAVRLLVDQIHAGAAPGQRVILPTELVLRASVRSL